MQSIKFLSCLHFPEASSLSPCVILHLARQDQPHTDVLNPLFRELSDTNLYPEIKIYFYQECFFMFLKLTIAIYD